MAIDYKNREEPYELFRDAKRRGIWEPEDIHLEQDKEDFDRLNEEEKEVFIALTSGFYDGEENVTRTLAPYMTANMKLENPPYDPLQEEMYLTTQMFEEAKHTDFFAIYHDEIIGTQNIDEYIEYDDEADYHTEDLYDLHDELLDVARNGSQDEIVHKFAEAICLYMGLIENQHARVGYTQYEQLFESLEEEWGRDKVLPGFQEGLTRIREDEGRHIRNGQWVMAQLAEMDESVVTDVYEPIFQRYIDKRLPPEFEDMSLEWDTNALLKCAKQSLETTIQWVGPEKWDSITDVNAAFESHSVPVPSDD